LAFVELCEKYMESSQLRNTENWCKDKSSRIKNKYLPFLGNYFVNEITLEIIDNLIMKIQRDVSNYTANRDLFVLSSIFELGVRYGYLQDNPCKKVERFSIDKKEKYIPEPEDIQKVLSVLSEERKEQAIVIIGLMARSNEILSERFTWGKNINFKNKEVILYTRKSHLGDLRPQKKRMTETVYQILQKRYLKRDIEIPFVFYNPQTKKPYTDRHWFQKACKKAGVKEFGLHTLRHYGASLLDSAGVNLKKIQSQLGHTSLKVTEGYVHDLSGDEKVLDALEQAVTTLVTTQQPLNEEQENAGSE
jgi:integrase